MKTSLTIGIPVKNEHGNILELKKQISHLIKLEKYSQLEFEIVINDNLSVDGSTDLLRVWEENESIVKLHTLETPLDFQATVRDLMLKANGEGFALYQSDMQDPINVLEKGMFFNFF